MLRLQYLWFQLTFLVMLSLYAQFRYLEYITERSRISRISIHEIIRNTRERVRVADDLLRRYADAEDETRTITTTTMTTSSSTINESMQSQANNSSSNDNNNTGNFSPSSSNEPRLMLNAEQLLPAMRISIDIRKPCGGDDGRRTTLLVMLYNRADDSVRRHTIRQTFGSVLRARADTEIYFLLASHPDSDVQSKLLDESRRHNDIIQLDYIDNYYKLTIKTIAMMRWIALRCSLTKFVLKLDDDSFIRVNPLIRWLQPLQPDMIFGDLEMLREAVRDNTSKWFISKRDFAQHLYPPYLVGVYIFPGKFAIRLYEAVMSEPIDSTIPALPFEDAYMTGIVASKAAIARFPFEPQLTVHEYHKNDTELFTYYSVFYNSLSPYRLKTLWNRFGEN